MNPVLQRPTIQPGFLLCPGFTNETVKASVYLVWPKTLPDYELKTLEYWTFEIKCSGAVVVKALSLILDLSMWHFHVLVLVRVFFRFSVPWLRRFFSKFWCLFIPLTSKIWSKCDLGNLPCCLQSWSSRERRPSVPSHRWPCGKWRGHPACTGEHLNATSHAWVFWSILTFFVLSYCFLSPLPGIQCDQWWLACWKQTGYAGVHDPARWCKHLQRGHAHWSRGLP